MPPSKKPAVADDQLLASLSLGRAGKNLLAGDQVALLEAIAATGSISAAAKQVGISYKTAWDRVDTMNNLAAQPLVLRAAGGSHGGGTQLTPFGQKVVAGFRAMEHEHRAYMQRLERAVSSIEDIAEFMQLGTLKTSARNQFRGTICAIVPGAVNAEVTVAISEQQVIHVIITEESRKTMGLEVGSVVVALIKSSSVMLSNDANLSISARNKLTGMISRVTRGAVNCDVTIDLGANKSLNAGITNTSVAELGLQEGNEVCAFFKASSVILLVE